MDDDDLNPGKSDGGSVQNENSLSPPPQHPPTAGHVGAKKRHRSTESIDEIEVPSPKKPSQNPLGLPGANIRINSRGDGRNGDSSLVVSLEINGTTYQGVLFAQPGSKLPTS